MFNNHSLQKRRLLSALLLTLLALSPAAILQHGPSGARASQSSADGSNGASSGKAASQGRPPALVEVAPVERAQVESRLQATGTLRAPEELMLKSRGRGRVAELRFAEGEAVSAGDTLLHLERDRAEAAVREAAATLSQAENAQARLQELSGRDFVSTQELEQAAATSAQARAALQLAREDLRDRRLSAPFDGVMGLFMRARLMTGRRDLLRVPEDAVVAVGPSEHLFVIQTGSGEPTRVARRTVSTGLRRDGWVEIRAGLDEGERVVVAGLQRLRDGRAVRIAKTGADGAKPAGDSE